MNKLLLLTLQTIVRSLIGALNYERIKTTVLNLESKTLSGEQKKQIVLDEAALVMDAVGRDLVSLAIKTAVLMVRSK